MGGICLHAEGVGYKTMIRLKARMLLEYVLGYMEIYQTSLYLVWGHLFFGF
jgi:hypothetical protein